MHTTKTEWLCDCHEGEWLPVERDGDTRPKGWMTLSIGHATYDFCSLPCLAAWTAQEHAAIGHPIRA